jgi:[ribosomal protein S5]-alanine N-acetyltransferase
MIRPLETRRLLLRPLQLEDAEDSERLFPQWEIVKYLTAAIPWPFPKGRVLPQYRDVILPAIERGEEWHWSLRLKHSPDHLIGKISLQVDEWDNRGYWLGLPWQCQGLMTEAVASVNDFWFDELGFNVLRAPKAVANIASRRISEKTGMRLVATLERDYVSGRLPAEIWEITADEWHAWKNRYANTSGL